MITKLQFNDLHLLLTPEDQKQIDEMPMPTWQQGELMLKTWDDYFGDKIVPETRAGVINGMIWLKPYLKVKQSMPELFL